MINNLKIIDKNIFTRGVSSYTTTKDLIEILIKKRDTIKASISHTIYSSGIEVLIYMNEPLMDVLVLRSSSMVKDILEVVSSFEFITLINTNKAHDIIINNDSKNKLYFYPVVINEKDISILIRAHKHIYSLGKEVLSFGHTVANDTITEETKYPPISIEKGD